MIESTIVITYKGATVDSLSHTELLRAFYALHRERELLKQRLAASGTLESIIETFFGKR